MDPNATLAAYWSAVSKGDRSGAREYKGYLKDWLRGGGFEPNWSASGHTRAEFMSGRKSSTHGRTVTAKDILGAGATKRRR